MMLQGKSAAFWGMALLVLAALLILCLHLSFGLYRKLFSSDAEQEVAEHIALKVGRLNVRSREALETRREVQEIIFEFERPMPEFDTGRPTAEVEAASPNVELLDEYGHYFPLRYGGASRNAIRYKAVAELPKDARKYVGLRVESRAEIPLRRIYWNCYNPWDRK
ncbi:MAG TPA: hypothetical protein VJT74_14925 [Pyrinomonadaceae bacterium]|nr:hypothetical protein [Pyrinomonadaceae bacterium]